MVLRRCAIIMQVRSFVNCSVANWIIFSDSESTEEVASCLGFLLTKKNAEGDLTERHRKFAEVHQDFLNRMDGVIRKLVNEHGSNLRHEELLSLTANYPEVERILIKGMQEGELQYKQLSSTQRDIKSLSCIYVKQ